MFDRLPDPVNGDEHLVWLGRRLDVDVLFEVGPAPHYIAIMDNLGHFPMSENPALFRECLLPVLDRIAAG